MLTDTHAACPYCGETIALTIDTSSGDQHYIEDCQVCCRPIEVVVTLDEDGEPLVRMSTDNDG